MLTFLNSTVIEGNKALKRSIQIPAINYKDSSIFNHTSGSSSIIVRINYIRNYLSLRKGLIFNNLLKKKYKQKFPQSDYSRLLSEKGVLGIKVSQALKDDILSRFADNIKFVISKRQSYFDYERAVVQCIDMLCSIKERGHNYEYFNKLCLDSGIYDVIQSHKNLPMQLKFVALQINDSTDKGILSSCEDKNGNLPITKYMHIDSNIDTMKCLIYLNNTVSQGRGSFSYVVGSHKSESHHNLAARKACDVTNIESRKESSQINDFLSLPKIFQHKANFGNDLCEGHHNKEIKMLLENEIYIEEPLASGCIFNPDGIHRGGFFSEGGERIMLQFMFEPKKKPSLFKRLTNKFKRLGSTMFK